MSYLEDAVDNALFAEHLVPADEKGANTMGMMKSALAVTAGKDRGVLLGVWVGCLGGWVWCPGDVLGGWAGCLLDVRGSNFCIFDGFIRRPSILSK